MKNLNPEDNKLGDLEKKLNLNFQNKSLLLNAFVHRSYLNEHKDYNGDSNERLEFLGDSVLSIVVSQYLFEKLPTNPEGKLTLLRAALVRTETLASLGKNILLGKYLLLSKGEEDSGGRNNVSILANTFEALVGAIYLDQGFETARNFITEIMLKKWKKLAQNAVVDNKSKLQEVLQREYRKSPTYKLISSWGPDHARNFEIGVYLEDKLLGTGKGRNKQQGAQSAAKEALEKLDN